MIPEILRTVQVVNVRWFNATVWYGLELARLLRDAGHDSRVIGLAGTESFEKARAMGLDPVAMNLNAKNPLEFPAVIAQIRRFVDAFRPHVVNCHRGESFVFWGMLKKHGGYALVRTRGDQRLPRGNWPNRFLHTRVADAVVATNTVMTRHFAEKMRVPAGRLYTILGGVNTDKFRFDPAGRAAMREKYGLKDEHFVIGLLGRFDRVKGQKESIESLARLVKGGMDHLRLLLLGFSSATTQEEVEGWIRQNGMERHVIITGKVADVPACLSAVDLGLVSSLWSETIARAALELMACGRPLVSTNVGVMPDLLPADALAVPGDAAGMDALLRRAAEDTPWREALARTCLGRIERDLTSRHFLQLSLEMYGRALENCRKG